jgi:hypothetical protein
MAEKRLYVPRMGIKFLVEGPGVIGFSFFSQASSAKPNIADPTWSWFEHD